MKFRSVLVAAMMLSASTFQANAACTTSTGFEIQDFVDAIPAGTTLDGTADCPTPKAFDPGDVLAVSAAHPSLYLSDSENFALSPSLGFADGATAVGIGGVMRLDKNWSAYASGAMSTEHSDIWSGNVGARFAW